MKDDVHPDYDFITVELNDGTTYKTRSTMDTEHFAPEVDATNHPFYTGKQRQVSRTGQVERFMKKYGMQDEDEEETNETDAAAETTRGEAEEAEEAAEEAEAEESEEDDE